LSIFSTLKEESKKLSVIEMSLQNEMKLDSIVMAATEQVSCELSGEAAVLDLRSGVYYGLNETGAFIWNQIKEPTSVRAIRDAMAAEYEVDVARCERDLFRILTELVDRGLVEVKDETHP
jgi:hypothetical protein